MAQNKQTLLHPQLWFGSILSPSSWTVGSPVDPVSLATFSLKADFCSDPSSQGLGVKWPCSLSSQLSLLNSFLSFLGMPPWIECYQNIPIPTFALTIIYHILIVLSFILGVFYSFDSLFHSSFLFLSPLWVISTSTQMTHQIPCPLGLHSCLPIIFSSAPCQHSQRLSLGLVLTSNLTTFGILLWGILLPDHHLLFSKLTCIHLLMPTILCDQLNI